MRHYSHRAHLAALETDVSKSYLCLSALAALLECVEEAMKVREPRPRRRVRLAARMHGRRTTAFYRAARLRPHPLPTSSPPPQTSFVKGTLAIKFLPAHGVMLLDPSTVANLELVRNLRTGDPHQSLFGALNKCLTQAGSRFLRSALLQPSTDLATISARLDAVSELLTRPEAIQDARKILPTFKVRAGSSSSQAAATPLHQHHDPPSHTASHTKQESERLLRHFMQKQTQSGCARAKSAITAVRATTTSTTTAPPPPLHSHPFPSLPTRTGPAAQGRITYRTTTWRGPHIKRP